MSTITEDAFLPFDPPAVNRKKVTADYPSGNPFFDANSEVDEPVQGRHHHFRFGALVPEPFHLRAVVVQRPVERRD